MQRFFLAGNPQQQQKQGSWQAKQEAQHERYQGVNIFQVFDTQVLAQALNVNPDTAKKLQNEDDKRGNIIRVKGDFHALIPKRQQVQEERGYMNSGENGLEETICTWEIKDNLAKPERADIYTARGGTISTANRYNLPLLKRLQLSAGRGFLHPNAMVVPHWNINAHSISYFAKGSARVQVVGYSRTPVFDGEVKEGQLLIIPQNFAHFKQAGNQGCEWYTLKTNEDAKISPVAGRTSVMRAIPEDVLINAFQFTREEARRVKYSSQAVTILPPRSEQKSIPMSIV